MLVKLECTEEILTIR